MLFDLRGRRKRMIQVVYAILAFLFLLGFVGFGIGSPGTGGIFDALGLGGGDSATSNPQFDEDISKAEAQLKKDPKNEQALLTLAEVHYAAGNSSSETDPETGQVTVTDESRTEYQESTAAWERYLKLNPKNPDPGTAAQVFRAYDALANSESDPAALESELKGGALTAKLIAEDNPSANTWATAARYAYLAGDTPEGDAAAAKAKQEASGSEVKQLDKLLAQAKTVGTKLQKQIKQAGPGKEALTSPPGGGLGGTPSPTGGGGAPAPPAP
jgi:tetratricopeptide (TPR) repeat protein